MPLKSIKTKPSTMRAITLLVFFFCFQVHAAILPDIEAKNYTFSDNTKLNSLASADLEHNAVFIIDKTFKELYSSKDWKGTKLANELLFTFTTYHKRIRLNNDKGVEEFITMYIRVSNDRDLISLKARSVNPDGTVTNFNESNIKFIEDYEGHGPMKIFAFEGVQVGAEIEYVYTIQEYDEDYYGQINVQSSFPKKEFSFEIIYPTRLIFKSKSYNKCPEMVLDSLNEDKHRLKISTSNVPFFDQEDLSGGDASRQRIEYVLTKNTSTNRENFFNWNKAQKTYTEFTYNFSTDPKLGKKEQKAMQKLIQSMNIAAIANEKDKLYAIEQYIKTKINIGTDYKTTLVHEITKNSTASFYGASRLYILLLTQLNINHEMVLTCDRFDKQFDGDFETFNFLSKILVYFPQYGAFTDPSQNNTRFGVIPYEYAYSKGLFLKMKEIGGEKAFFSEVKDIPGLPYEVTYSNIFADVKMSEEMDNCLIKLKLESMGYHDLFPRPFLTYLNPEKKDEIIKGELKIVKDGTEVIDYKIKNEEMSGYMLNTPFIVEGNIKIESLLEKAGQNYLLKIGLVIGPQMEMYKTKERKMPVVLQYNHGYQRVINFTIPEGYKITNLPELKMDVFYLNNGERTMEFVSKYELKGNVLSIKVTEFYNEINVPLKRFEEYRAVVNAAADFNKKILVLQKK